MQDGVTRRRALGLGAAAGLGAAGLGVLLSRPVSAIARTSTAPVGFGLRVRPSDFPGGGRVSRVLSSRRRFELVGLRGARGDVEIRFRPREGRWSPWVALAPRDDHAPDTGSGARASEPVWTGGSDELQLRSAAPVGSDLELQMVSVPDAARRQVRPQRLARAAQAPAYPPPPAMVSRTAWGADQVPPRAAPSYGAVQMAFVHHTVNANTYSKADSAGIVLAIAKYHRDTNGWNDIGYNFLVDQYGQIFEGRGGGIDQPVIGAHAQGWNSNSTGVAIIGTFTSVAPPPAALEAVAQIVGWKLSLHGVPITGTVGVQSLGGSDNRYPAGRVVTFQRISGHRDGCATTCPGDSGYASLPSIRSRAAKYTFTLPSGSVAQVSLVPDSSAVVYGRQARVSGIVLRGGGSPAAGEPVLVQQLVGSAWQTVAQTTADAAGGWTMSLTWQATAQLRAQAGGMNSPPATIACLPAVSSKSLPARVSAGSSVTLRGTVLPAVPVWVLVERKVSGRWRRVTSVRAKVSGAGYSAKVKLATSGTYRLTAKAGQPGASAAAKARTVTAVRRARSRAVKAPRTTSSSGGGISAS